MKESVNLFQNIKVDYDHIFKQIEQTDHDISLLKEYKKRKTAFPVYEGTEGVPDGTPELTRYGFVSLMCDKKFMNGFFVPRCRKLMKRNFSKPRLDAKKIHSLRASLIEFALLGSIEAQDLLDKINQEYGHDDAFISSIVMTRWPQMQNLDRFLSAQEGVGLCKNGTPTYNSALREIQGGCKRSHWISYIFPQICDDNSQGCNEYKCYGIKGQMEAVQYINHPVLRQRLIEMTKAVMNCGYSIYEIFSKFDVRIFKSCINLFASVSDIPIFDKIRTQYGWKYSNVFEKPCAN